VSAAPASAASGNAAPYPCSGTYADGFAPVAQRFAGHFRAGAEIGAGLTVYQRGRCVVDLWGGSADVALRTPWARDTRIVVFSVTKGLAAMALALLADRGELDWDAPVATHWPGFAAAGKDAISARTLFNHRAGLVGLRDTLTLDDCVLPERYPALVQRLERERPLWEPGRAQGYHAATFGMYARALFEQIRGESIGTFLRRELFEPLGADVSLGTPADVDARIATLYSPTTSQRLLRMFASTLRGDNNEARLMRATLPRDSLPRKAFLNPQLGPMGLTQYNALPVRRSELAWASATASAHGVARAYLPFASAGASGGRRYLRAASLAPIYERQGWSEQDLVLQKPLGWSQGFLKEELTVFSPTRESFGHAGLGGALGWCDPVKELTFGYAMNNLDWRVRSPRAVALCRALYQCEPVRSASA